MEFGASSVTLARRRLAAYALPVVIMILTATAASLGQAPSATTAEAPAMERTDAVPQNGSANGNPESSVPQRSTPQGAADNDKGRLAVNPVTGVVTTAAANYRPLTGRERWKLTGNKTISPSAHISFPFSRHWFSIKPPARLRNGEAALRDMEGGSLRHGKRDHPGNGSGAARGDSARGRSVRRKQ